MATIYEVAHRAGVSTATVSAVLNRSAYVSPELTKRVKKATGELDYRINYLARSLQLGRTHTVGMLIPLFGTPDPFYAQVVQGVEDVLRKKDYALVLGQTYNDVKAQSRYISTFRARYVDGILLFQAPGSDPELDKLLKERKPLVFVGRVPEGLDVDIVATDVAYGTRTGIEHLLRKGHQRVGLITVRDSLSVRVGRINGWKQAHRKQGLTPDESYIRDADLSTEGGKKATLELLELPAPPSAIFVDNLMLTIGVIKALQEKSVASPDQVEVMSSDDAEWLDVFHLPISTVVPPSYELGVQSAEMLLRRIRHPRRKFETILLKPELRIR